MKKLLTTLLLVLLPAFVYANFTVPLVATSTTQGWAFPTSINGSYPSLTAPTFVATSTTATSSFANGINLTKGCFSFNNVCISGSGTSGVTSVATNNGLTGGTITTTGTLGLDITKLQINTLISWDGSRLIATGTPLLVVGNIVATTTTATSSFTRLLVSDYASTSQLMVSGSATSTFTSGINVKTGCFAVNGICIGGSSGSGTVTSVDVSGGTTGLSFSGGPITTSGTITESGTLNVTNGGTGQTSFGQGNLMINDTGAFISTTSPTFASFTATSTNTTNATSSIWGSLVLGVGNLYAASSSLAMGSTSSGYINAGGSGSFAGGAQKTNGGTPVNVISALGPGSFAYGNTLNFTGNSATITATSSGSIAMGYSNGSSLMSGGRGSVALGSVQGNVLNSTGDGSMALGTTLSGGTIVSSGTGSFALGVANGVSISRSTLIATGTGAFALGNVTNTFVTSAGGDGSFAWGNGVSSTNNQSITFGQNVQNDFVRTFMIGFDFTGLEKFPIFTANNSTIGVSTTTPFAKLSIQANPTGNILTNLFTIASSTQSATTTLFTVLNSGLVGIGTSTPGDVLAVGGNILGSTIIGQSFLATSTLISTFPYASSTAFSTGTLCLTADICRTTWPAGGGSVTTITAGTNITLSSGATCTTTCTINAAGGTGVFPFTSFIGYNATSTALGLFNGFFSNASSTFNASTTFNATTTFNSIVKQCVEYPATSTSMNIDWSTGCNTKIIGLGTSGMTITQINMAVGENMNLVTVNPRSSTAGTITWGNNIFTASGGLALMPGQTTAQGQSDHWAFSFFATSSPTVGGTPQIFLEGQVSGY